MMAVTASQDFGQSVIVADSITHVGPRGMGKVVVNGSHAGAAAAAIAASLGVRATIFNDAGVGLQDAGISGLRLLEGLGIAAAAVGHMSARIGDGQDTWANGIITHANAVAARLGVAAGQSCETAALRLEDAPMAHLDQLPYPPDTRRRISDDARPILLVDSASEIRPEDAGMIVVTGSHGGLPGARPENAVKADVFAVFFNDAGVGRDRAGLSRLPALDARGIVAATVFHDSAMIGHAASTYNDGVVSFLNVTAGQRGGKTGEPLRRFIERLVAHAQTRSS